MNIEELPIEILMKIFNYLPSYKNVSIVNKHFYSIACDLYDSKINLELRSELFVSNIICFCFLCLSYYFNYFNRINRRILNCCRASNTRSER